MKEITHEEVREHLGMWSRKARPLMRAYITQQETKEERANELKAKVKRYFEIKHKGILSIEDTNEHRKLLDEIMELVGIDNV